MGRRTHRGSSWSSAPSTESWAGKSCGEQVAYLGHTFHLLWVKRVPRMSSASTLLGWAPGSTKALPTFLTVEVRGSPQLH